MLKTMLMLAKDYQANDEDVECEIIKIVIMMMLLKVVPSVNMMMMMMMLTRWSPM